MAKKLKIAVLISGSGSNLQALIDACGDAEFPAEIALVISNKQDAFGLERAQKADIATKFIDHKDYNSRAEFDDELHRVIKKHSVELICLAGFMRLLTAQFTQKWAGRMINIHPSLLPDFKGANAHRDVIAAGVKTSGCTVHFVTAEMDSGEIIAQASVPVLHGDSEKALAARVLKQEHIIYPKALEKISHKILSSE